MLDDETLKDICKQVDEAFSGDRTAVTVSMKEYRAFKVGKIRAVAIPEAGLKFLEQNPDKVNRRTGQPSDGARAARRGHRVVWILVDDRYSGAGILDGSYTPSLHKDLRALAKREAVED